MVRLALYDVSTQEIRYLTDWTNMLDIGGWSSNNREVAFVSDLNGNYDLYTVDVEIDEARQLTNDPAIEFAVNWLPDQNTILFGTFADDRIPEMAPFGVDMLYLIDTEDLSLSLLDDSYYENISIDPNGRRIVYSRAFNMARICTFDLESQQENCDLLGEWENRFALIEGVAWSADGTMLAFGAVEPGELCQKAYVVDLNTHEVSPVGAEGCDAGGLHWSPTSP
jgi:Tol biopolymer transport system component